MRRTNLVLAFLPLLAATGRADVTMRQSFNVTSAVVPQQVWDSLKHFVSFPVEVTTRVKGDRAYSSFGPMVSIMDMAKNQLTLLDTRNRKFATVPIDKYITGFTAAQPEMPPEAAKLLEAMQLDVKTRPTGRTETIQGVPTDESEITVTLDMPIPGQTVSMKMVLTLQIWRASLEASQKVPAVREMLAYSARTKKSMDPAAFMKQLFAKMPGFGDKISGPIEQLTNSTSMLMKIRGQLTLPAMAAAMQPGAQPGAAPGPTAELTMDVLALSSDPVPDALLQVPEGYQSAPIEELTKSMMPAPPQPPAKK